MPCRGVRGATTVEANTADAILEGTRQLLALMIRQNEIEEDDVASAIISTTTDLDAEFPALAARQLGWFNLAMICVHELDVPGSLRRCIRILMHWNTEKSADEIVHVYIKEAANLGPAKGHVAELEKMLPRYYEIRGWSEQGVPSGETLQRLGLA